MPQRKPSVIVKDEVERLSDLDAARTRRKQSKQKLADVRANPTHTSEELRYAELDFQHAERDVVIAKILIAMGTKLKAALDGQVVGGGGSGEEVARLRAEVQAQQLQLNEMAHRNQRLADELEAVQQCEVVNVENTNMLAERRVHDLEETVRQLTQKMQTLECENRELKEDLDAKTDDIKNWRARARTFEQTMTRYKSDAEKYQKELEDMKAQTGRR
eukprot:comp18462_c0_seq1/m.19771 comp18462_c0_seq1/g.19771  ORF comp18462_c0_seq1/g.19771 comp18462_c0_seq1/m.19771 type:complete len:217 (-) comp18462_c0_seq1:180-830(-)